MKRFASHVIIAALGLMSTAAPAQSPDIGSIIPKTRPVTNDHDGTVRGDLARRIADGFAVCVVGRHYKAVLKALTTPVGSAERNKAITNLMDRNCLNNGSLSFSSVGVQGSLYKALVIHDLQSKRIEFSPTPLDFEKLEMTATGFPIASSAAQMLNFAGCLVRHDTQHSKALILSKAGSKGEIEAVNALRPAMDACVGATQRLSFGRDYLSAAVAEAFYREAQVSISASNP